MDLKLLDCTLRDGGYVNDWNFGRSTAVCVFERLVSANIDLIEVGFLDERVSFDIDRTIAPDTGCFDKIFSGADKKDARVFAMIDYGTCGIDNIMACDDSFLDGIRIIFKIENVDGALELASQIKAKGYDVSLQLVSITSYSDRDLLDFIDKANAVGPYAVSIVDTYGLMHKEEMLHYFDLLNHNLSEEIIIGYHSHNNFQLAYANTIELLKVKTNRTLSVDGTIYGMGKSAGNAPLELLAMHLNENYNGNYDLNQILEALDDSIMRIYKENYWGYSLKFYMSAMNDCHPSYITYLLNKKTLSVKSINDIVNQIKPELKLSYKEEHIKELYRAYQEHYTNDNEDRSRLKDALGDRSLLILAPGSTLKTHKDVIKKYIKEEKPLVITANTVPEDYDLDYVFISNAKRYSTMFEHMNQKDKNFDIISTSNVTSANAQFDFVLDYAQLLGNDIIADNSVIMLLQFLIQIGVKNVAIAGFDGFSTSNENYYDEELDYRADAAYLEKINSAIRAKIAEYSSKLNIRFLTPSAYTESQNV